MLASLLVGLSCVLQGPTHGDMVGEVGPDTALVWTRAPAARFVFVSFGTSPTLANANKTLMQVAAASSDFTLQFQLTGLSPATRYYYATSVADANNKFVRGPIGSFRTAPRPDAAVPVVFAFGADLADVPARFPILDKIAAHSPEFFVCLGDYPYTDASPPATTLADYRNKHKAVRVDATLLRFFRDVATFPVWDDHEVANDWNAATSPARVIAGTQAWREFFPVDASRLDIYRSFRWGSGVEVFLLDTRRYRSANAAPDTAGKTMLGAAQLAWLEQALATSAATWKLVCTTVPLRYGTTGQDHWTGFIHERQALFDFIDRKRIRGVVFLSGDQHWAAVHHHREGFREIQACPLSAGLRQPGRMQPEIRFLSKEFSYGIVRVDPRTSQETLGIEIYGLNGLLHTETFADVAPASWTLSSDDPRGQFRLENGPLFVRGSGESVELPRVEPGKYRLDFSRMPEALGRPAALDLDVAPAARVSAGASWRDVDPPAHRLLHASSFEKPLSGFTVVDEGTLDGPSAWFTDAGTLVQGSNIYGPVSGAHYPGSFVITGDATWQDYSVHTRVWSDDDDGVGVVFRYTDAKNYYLFAMDRQRKFRRITRTSNGVTSVLASDQVQYEQRRWYDIRVVASGSALRVDLDGTTILQATDSAHAAGRVGLYTYGNVVTLFDDLVVRAGDTRALEPPTLFSDDFSSASLTGWTITDQGTTSAPSNWVVQNGRLLQTSNIYGGSLSRASLPKPGTMALAGSATWTDYRISATLANSDNDGIGVVFRAKDANNLYRFSMDSERGYRRLAKAVGGSWTLLHETGEGYELNRDCRVTCEARGARLSVWIDGDLFADVEDTSLASGRAGLYVWGSTGASFDDVIVQRLGPERAVLAAITSGKTIDLFGRAPANPQAPYLLLLSLSRSPGIPLAAYWPNDPRTLHLTPDGLFLISLTGFPLFENFTGSTSATGALHARIKLASVPGLQGLPFFASGLVLNATSVSEVLPAIGLVFP